MNLEAYQYNREHPPGFVCLNWPTKEAVAAYAKVVTYNRAYYSQQTYAPPPDSLPYDPIRDERMCLVCKRVITRHLTITADNYADIPMSKVASWNKHVEICEPVRQLRIWGLISLFLDDDERLADVMLEHPREMAEASRILQEML